jgi:hypothetical protein
VSFVDSNVLVVDLRYPDDANHRVNRRALDPPGAGGQGMTSVLNLLEVCGILSFNLSASALHGLYVHFARRYRITVVPAASYDTRLPVPQAGAVLAKMEQRMALKDAEIGLVIEQHATTLEAVITWNAKHFAGKLPVPRSRHANGYVEKVEDDNRGRLASRTSAADRRRTHHSRAPAPNLITPQCRTGGSTHWRKYFARAPVPVADRGLGAGSVVSTPTSSRSCARRIKC